MSSDKIDELLNRFVVLIVREMKDAVFNSIEDEEEENEELQGVIRELKELEYKGLLDIWINLILNFGGESDDEGNEEETIGRSGGKSADKTARTVKLDLHINQSPEDSEMAGIINLTPKEIADMEKAVAEVRRESGGDSQSIADDGDAASVHRTAEEIIYSIREYARQYVRPFDRHLFIYIFAKASVFSILGNIMPDERDPQVIRYLADIGIWIKKFEEIVELIMALADEDQKMEMLYLVEEYLRQGLEVAPR